MPNLNKGPALNRSTNFEAVLATQPPTNLTTFASLLADTQTQPGVLAYTSDQEWCYWNGVAWVAINPAYTTLPSDPSVIANTDLVAIYSQANSELVTVPASTLSTFIGSIALANATSITLNSNYPQNYTVNTQTAGTLTVVNPIGTPVEGQRLTLRIKSTHVQTYSWGGAYRGSSSAALPTASTGSSENDYLGFIYNSTDSTWDFVTTVTGF